MWRTAVASANGRYEEFVKTENETKKFGIQVGGNIAYTVLVAVLNFLFPSNEGAQFNRYLVFFGVLGYFGFSVVWPLIFIAFNVTGPLLDTLERRLLGFVDRKLLDISGGKVFRTPIQGFFDPEDLPPSKLLNDIIEKFWSKEMQHRYQAHYVNLANKYLANMYLASVQSTFLPRVRTVHLDFGDRCPLTIAGINIINDVDEENEDDIICIPKVNSAFLNEEVAVVLQFRNSKAFLSRITYILKEHLFWQI